VIGDEATEFDLSADLTPAAMSIKVLEWRKLAGIEGRLEASGRFGDPVSVHRLDLKAAGLRVKGALDLAGGALETARFDRFVLPGVADIVGSLRMASDGVPEVRIVSGSVDFSNWSSRTEGGVIEPIRFEFNLDRLAVSSKVVFEEARGRLEQHADGGRSGALDATMGQGVPVEILIANEGGGRTRLTLVSPDAGAALAAAGLYRDARNGLLTLDATIGGGGPGISGQARIENVIVRSEATFRDVLHDGGLSDAEREVAGDGLQFRKVWIPFVYENGVISLDDVIASSPALALKVNGTLHEKTEHVDLIGVLTPAYVLTGILNEIPIVGEILSGGEGEGILAITFSLKGAMRDPQLSVNPLSLLTPGFLRRIFGGAGASADENSSDQLNRTDRR